MTADPSHRRPTGADLRAHRKAAGLTQVELARLAGCSRETVQYWEKKPAVDVRAATPRRLCHLVGMRGFVTTTRTHVGWGVTRDPDVLARGAEARRARRDAEMDVLVSRVAAQRAERVALQEAQQASRLQVRCGAVTRKGTACRHWSELGRRRCKSHRGRSTGPTTPEGRARIADAQRRRWAAWRAAREDAP